MAIDATLKCLPLALLLLGGCARAPAVATPATLAVEPAEEAEAAELKPNAWQRFASDADADRIERTGAAWEAALADARRRGFGKAIAAEGELLDPAAALPRAAPPPGSYYCRVIKLGAHKRDAPAFAAFKPFFCHVEAEGELLTIVKQTGSQRPAGWLYPETDERLVFLGTLALGNEDAPIMYSTDPSRDMAGVVERVAPFRWRLVIPWPQSDSKLDVFELVPAAQ